MRHDINGKCFGLFLYSIILGVSDIIVILMTFHRLQTLSKIARFGQRPESDLKVRTEMFVFELFILKNLDLDISKCHLL